MHYYWTDHSRWYQEDIWGGLREQRLLLQCLCEVGSGWYVWFGIYKNNGFLVLLGGFLGGGTPPFIRCIFYNCGRSLFAVHPFFSRSDNKENLLCWHKTRTRVFTHTLCSPSSLCTCTNKSLSSFHAALQMHICWFIGWKTPQGMQVRRLLKIWIKCNCYFYSN